MADAVFSVRLDEELKAKFMDMAQQSGINNKDMMELLVSNYELTQMGEGSLGITDEVSELQHITKRMMDIYVNMIEKTQMREIEYRNKELKEVQLKENKIIQLEEKIQELLEKGVEVTELKDRIKSMKHEKEKIVHECEDLKEMNRFLKEKNKQLETTVSENESKIESIDYLKNQVVVLTAALEDQKGLVKTAEDKIKFIQVEYEEKLLQKQLELDSLEKRYLERLELMGQKQALEISQLTLELKQTSQEQLMTLREEFVRKMNEMTSEKEGLIKQLTETFVNRA